MSEMMKNMGMMGKKEMMQMMDQMQTHHATCVQLMNPKK